MAKTTDYNHFLKYAKDHMNLTPLQIINTYKAQYPKTIGYGVQKQAGLKYLAETFGYEQGTQKGKTLQERFNSSKAKEYVYTPYQKRTPAYKGKGKEKGSNNYIVFDKKRGFTFIDTKQKLAQKLREKIQHYTGSTKEKFIQIDVTIEDDGYTKNNTFSVWIPFNGRNKQGAKATGQKILGYLNSYYSTLANRYSTDNRGGMSKSILTTLKSLKREMNNTTGLTHDGLVDLFNNYGINLETFELISFTNYSKK